MKVLLTALVLMASQMANGQPHPKPSRLVIVSPHHPGETVRITVACDGFVQTDGALLWPELDVTLDTKGRAETTVYANKQLRCTAQPGAVPRYDIALLDANGKPAAEKTLTVRNGKTRRVKL